MPRYVLLQDSNIQTDNIDSSFRSLRKTAGNQEVLRIDEGGHTRRINAPTLGPDSGLRKTALRQSGIYAGSEFLEPNIRNPLLSASNFYLPNTLVELNAWIRYFDRFHPIVGNAMDMHATVPFSRFMLTGISDSHVQRFYEDMADKLNMFRRILEISREYELLGEVFPFAHWSDEMNAFDDITILNPDYIDVKGVKMAGGNGIRYEMVISEELHQFINSDDPLDWEIVQGLDPSLIRAAENGLNAPLDPFNLSHLARLASPYDMRGSSIALGCIKDLMYEEQLREAQYAIAGGIVRPREIWKLGVKGEYMPTDTDLQDLRSLLRSAEYDPNFAIISHHGLAVDFVGADRRILPLDREYQELEKRILTRLYTSRAMTHGEGPTYSNASVAMKILDARYATKRDFIVDWIINSIFVPVALANEFYKPVKRELAFQYRVANRDRELMVPEFKWLSLVNLVERQQQIQYALQLVQKAMMPMKVVCDLLQLDYDEVKEYLRREQGTVVDGTWQEVRKQAASAAARNIGTGEGGGEGGLFPEAPRALKEPDSESGSPPKGRDVEQDVEDQAQRDTTEDARSLEKVNEDVEKQRKLEEPASMPQKTFGLDKKKVNPSILAGEEFLGRIPKDAEKLLTDFSPDSIED